MFNHTIYLDIAGYRTLDTHFQRAMGVSTDGETQIPGVAPYWRLGYTKSASNQSFEIGIFGLFGDTYPGRVSSAGKITSSTWASMRNTRSPLANTT